jgi:hypothetical protein
MHQDDVWFALNRLVGTPKSIRAIGRALVLDVVNNKVVAVIDVSMFFAPDKKIPPKYMDLLLTRDGNTWSQFLKSYFVALKTRYHIISKSIVG